MQQAILIPTSCQLTLRTKHDGCLQFPCFVGLSKAEPLPLKVSVHFRFSVQIGFHWEPRVCLTQTSVSGTVLTLSKSNPTNSEKGPGKVHPRSGHRNVVPKEDMRNERFAPHHNHNSYQEQHSNDCDNRHGALFYGGRCWKTEAVIIVRIQFLEAERYCNEYKHITDPSSRNSYPDCTCFAQDGPHSLCGLLFHAFLHVHTFEMVIP